MWIFTNTAMLSIVQVRKQPGYLLVRSRIQGDIETVFPQAKVRRTPRADYLYRATVPRAAVAKAMANEVKRINYDNFKGSVPNNNRHNLYTRLWATAFDWCRNFRRPTTNSPRATSGRLWPEPLPEYDDTPIGFDEMEGEDDGDNMPTPRPRR